MARAKATPEKKAKVNIEKPVKSGLNQGEPKKCTKFQPGQSGNPAGKPKGTRHKLNEDFIVALCADFNEHGKSVIATVRTDKPDIYLKVVASLQPKEIDIRDKTLEDMTDQEVYDALAEIRSFKAVLNGGAANERKAAAGRGQKRPSQLN